MRLLQRKRELFGTNTLNHEGMLVRRMDELHLQWFHRQGSLEMRALSRTERRTLAKVVNLTARNIRPSLETFRNRLTFLQEKKTKITSQNETPARSRETPSNGPRAPLTTTAQQEADAED